MLDSSDLLSGQFRRLSRCESSLCLSPDLRLSTIAFSFLVSPSAPLPWKPLITKPDPYPVILLSTATPKLLGLTYASGNDLVSSQLALKTSSGRTSTMDLNWSSMDLNMTLEGTGWLGMKTLNIDTRVCIRGESHSCVFFSHDIYLSLFLKNKDCS